MKNTYFLLVLLSTFIVVQSSSCCKDDPPKPPDPCIGLNPINAGFSTSEVYSFDNQEFKAFESDTFVYGRTVTFTANQNLDSYEWHVGFDPRIFTEKSFSLEFEVLGDVEITLIVYDEYPNTTCFPDDDGRDTIIKTITFIPIEEVAIIGKYRGVRAYQPNDTFTIEILRYWDEPEGEFVNQLLNFPEGCHLNEPWPVGEGVAILLSNDYCRLSPHSDNFLTCPIPRGWGFLSEDYKTITLEYSINIPDLNHERINDTFIGTKIE